MRHESDQAGKNGGQNIHKIRARANTKGVYLSVKSCQCVLYKRSGNNTAAVLICLMLKVINDDAAVHVEEQGTSGARFCV